MKKSAKIALVLILLAAATFGGTLAYSNILHQSERTDMVILVEKDKILLNPYGIIPVNPERYPQRNSNMAVAFVKFLISEEGQNLIADFRKDGETLFIPIAHIFTVAKALGFLNQEQEVEWYSAQTTSPNMDLPQSLLLATTTSTYESGLLDYLIPFFEERYNIKVHAISVGTGQAIELAKRGDADVVLVHSKELEESFVREGYGVHRVGVMYNDFVLIGPSNDPSGIRSTTNATEAFRKIAETGAEGKALFISRADKSGTHLLELKIWAQLGIQPSGSKNTWYLEAGASMATVLRMANEKQAYTLIDRGMWLSKKGELSNSVLNGFFKAIELIVSFNPEVVSIMLLTLGISGTATLLGSVLGIPFGTFLGWSSFAGKRPLTNLVNILSKNIVNTFMGLPPILVGLVVYLLFSASGPMSPFKLLFTPTAMIVAQLIMVVPIITGVTLSAVSGVDRAIRERALSLGATEWQASLTVLREARIGILTAIVVAFGAAISEVGGIMIVGGNIRWYTRVLTTAILYETELGNFEIAIALGIILLSLAFAVNLILTYLQLKGVKR
jgi:tungstate transport system permease protein